MKGQADEVLVVWLIARCPLPMHQFLFAKLLSKSIHEMICQKKFRMHMSANF
jgi:hypothetical protein